MRVSAIEGHRLWAPVYDSGFNPLLALERRAMNDVLKQVTARTILDVACGTGRWLLHFQRAGSRTFGCDACEQMLRAAMKHASLRGCVAVGDAERIPVSSSFAGLVLCSVSLGYFRNLEQVFREFARTAKPGGFVAVSDMHPDAAAAGWTRSFKVGEQRYELEHYPRKLAEIDTAASNAGLQRKSRHEVCFGAPEFPIFERAGKKEIFTSLLRVPALFIGLWENPC
jgi:ubiquinone/menaquinone biosynthesis C-methylase UbiE